jgi:predicted dinucleotide-binding enzyme
MRIGVVGSGSIGGTLAPLLATAGHRVVVANTRGPESLRELAATPGVTAGTLAEAAGAGELVVLPIAGDDPAAKGLVAHVITDIGFAPLDLGGLAQGRRQQPGTPVYNVRADLAQTRARLAGG